MEFLVSKRVKNEIFFSGFGNFPEIHVYPAGFEWFQRKNGCFKKVGLNPPGGNRYWGKGGRMGEVKEKVEGRMKNEEKRKRGGRRKGGECRVGL